MRFSSLLFVAATLTTVLVDPARGQTLFRAVVDGGQVVPPVVTDAGGYARFVLNANDTLTYEVRTWVVSGSAAHIHTGALGAGGPLLFTLSGGPSIWSGTTAALTATDKTNLRASGLYVSVESAVNPSGEIRGQIGPAPRSFATKLSGDQETPPNASTASGEGTAIANSDGTITYNVTTTGVTGTAAHIHSGAFNVGGPIVFFLTGGPSNWSGTTPVMTAAQFEKLQTSLMYFNVHSGAFPGGEIRGQLIANEVPYGFGYASSVGIPSLDSSGEAIRGGTVDLTLTGGLPNGLGLLVFSLTDGIATLKKKVPYLVGAPLLILPLTLDAGGGFALSGAIPDLSASIDVYFQFLGLEPGGANGDLYASNGLLIPIADY